MTLILLKNRSNDDPYADIDNTVEFVPLMEHSWVDEEGLHEYLESQQFERIDCTIVTSQRAVEALANQFNSLTDVARISLLSKPTYTVGPATASLLRSHGFTDVRGDDSGNGTALSKVLKTLDFEKYVFFTGETRRDAIPDTLNSMDSVSLVERVVYQTVQIKDSVEETVDKTLKTSKGTPIVTFFSPTYADAVTAVLKRWERSSFKLAAIGPTTEEYLKSNDLIPDAVAERPDPESLKKSISLIQ